MEHAFEQLDPRQAWQPADLSQWDLRRVGHLYRRAAFGFPAAEASEPSWVSLRERVKLGAEGCLEELLGKPGDTASPTRVDQLLDQLGERIASGDFSPGNLNKLQGWWLYRMLYSPRPLIERATLMWHNPVEFRWNLLFADGHVSFTEVLPFSPSATDYTFFMDE